MMERFEKVTVENFYYLRKTLHLRCLTGFYEYACLRFINKCLVLVMYLKIAKKLIHRNKCFSKVMDNYGIFIKAIDWTRNMNYWNTMESSLRPLIEVEIWIIGTLGYMKLNL